MKRTVILVAILFAGASVMAGAASPEAFDRGLGDAKNVFIPKGMMSLGATMSYNTLGLGNSRGDFDVMSVLTGVQGNMKFTNISPSVFYFVKNNTAVGLRFGYDYSQIDLDKASLSLSDELNVDLSNHYYVSQGFSGQIALRTYVPLFGSKVFAMFSEFRVGGSQSQGKIYSLDGVEKDGVFEDSYSMNLGVYPGLTAFVTNNLSFEVAVTMLECRYSYTQQIRNQVHESSYTNFKATFKPNILGISFAIMYYIPIKK